MEELFKMIDVIILAQKKARQNNDYLTLMSNGGALLERVPQLINYSVEEEAEYRKFEAKLTNEGTADKKNTSSYCETQAKATDAYKEWQKAKQFIELMYEMVNLAKMLARSVNKEFNAS